MEEFDYDQKQSSQPELDVTVFVYGTLKSGGQVRGLDLFNEHSSIVGKAKTVYPDYEMIDLGAFPGVITQGKNYIEGEVWNVSKQAAEELDAIEGYPDFYNKIQVDTTKGKAIMYFLDRKAYKKYIGPSEQIEEIVDSEENITQTWIG